MTAQAKQFSPELIHLLSDILADPTTVFSRLSRMRPSLLFDRPLSPGTAFLSNAERHILDRHRAEVARLLYEGCMLTLQGPVEKTRTIFAHKEVEEADWNRDVRKIFRAPAHRVPREREELRYLNDLGGLTSRAARLALAMAPSDETRFALVCTLRLDGDAKSSLEATESWRSVTVSPGWEATAASQAATTRWSLGEIEAAMIGYREAASTSAPGRFAPLYWFLQAVELERYDEAKNALISLEENFGRFASVSSTVLNALGPSYLAKRGVTSDQVGWIDAYCMRNGLFQAIEVVHALV